MCLLYQPFSETGLFSPSPLLHRCRGSRCLSGSLLFTDVHNCHVFAYIEISHTMTCGITPFYCSYTQQSVSVYRRKCEIYCNLNVQLALLADKFITIPDANSCCTAHVSTETIQLVQPVCTHYHDSLFLCLMQKLYSSNFTIN